jgi:hypothetical protein
MPKVASLKDCPATSVASVKSLVAGVVSTSSVSSLYESQPAHSVSNGDDTRICAPLLGNADSGLSKPIG